ncbi:ArsA family ATPase [uncultured Robinsoniella sp.]|uniref:ArsA family ATPase n=1 Tax=uncultured Robinsoniella sp. TaxID=904190 RepID=UPI00374E3319
MRILLYTGKGGVGKTSIAAVTACKIAESGKRVLIMSTDQAHSLGDSFDRKLGNEPLEITEHLYAMEIDAVAESEHAWGNIKDYLKKLLTSRSGESIEAEELLIFPGFEELFSLFKILDIYEAQNYDVLIVDCAPTGETISLLKFPEMFGYLLGKIMPMKRKALKVAGPLVEKTMKIPMPKDTLFDEVEILCSKIEQLQDLMSDKDVLSLRIVTTPEKIVVKEAKRNFAYLHMYDYNVDAIIVNKVYPKSSLEGYFNQWIENQQNSLQDIRQSFFDIPVFEMEFLKHELRTVERLKVAADMVYRDTDPAAVLAVQSIFVLEKVQEKYCLKIALPFVDKQELELEQKGEELALTIKNERRNLILPPKLREYEVAGAKYEKDMLKIEFEHR